MITGNYCAKEISTETKLNIFINFLSLAHFFSPLYPGGEDDLNSQFRLADDGYSLLLPSGFYLFFI